MDTLTLTTPQQVTSSAFTVQVFHAETNPAFISITVADNNGNTTTNTYSPTPSPSGATAASLLHALNTANFTVNSLHKKILQQLQLDGYLPAGSISGTPA